MESVFDRSWDSEGSVEAVFGQAGPGLAGCHLVVCVDEAQNAPMDPRTREALDSLHRIPRGLPWVVAFFGLSDTQSVLDQAGLSRFAAGRAVNLEPLALDEVVDAIRSVFAAYGFTGTPQDRDMWVTHLAELSPRWPQHINRLAAVSSQLWVYKRLAEAAGENGGRLSIDRIKSLMETVRGKTGESVDRFLNQALHASLLVSVRDRSDHYRIPIPSFGDYLRALLVEPPQA